MVWDDQRYRKKGHISGSQQATPGWSWFFDLNPGERDAVSPRLTRGWSPNDVRCLLSIRSYLLSYGSGLSEPRTVVGTMEKTVAPVARCMQRFAASRNPAGEQLLEQQGARTCWALRGEVWEIEIVPLELQPRSLLKFLDHKSDLGRKCQCTFFFLLLDKLVFIKWSLLMPWSCACLGFLQLNFFFLMSILSWLYFLD